MITLPEGEVILDFHKYIRNIPLVVSGSVKVLGEDEDGNEITLYHIKPGESCIMSIMGALNNSESVVKAVTLESTEIALMKATDVYPLISENRSWFNFIMQLYQTRFEELLQTVARVSFKTTEQRILEHLLKRAALLKTRVVITTHSEIAGEIGTAREVVSRGLKNLEKKKQVKLFRGKVVVM